MIEVRGLTKRYGQTTAVDDLSFTVEAGNVTGFLGPNGAGKSTTMRMMLGLDHPSAGTVTFNGRSYRELAHPLRSVGALLDAKWVHPNRSAAAHLKWMACSNRIPTGRVDEVLDLVGLTNVAGKRAGGFSLGMSQRLGIAGALLGDPAVLLFDEPVNGLDPEGILWIRHFMQGLAAEGRTVLVSSHLMSEMALTARELVVIGRGRLIAQCTTEEFVEAASEDTVRLRSVQADQLATVLADHGMPSTRGDDGRTLIVTGGTTDRVAELAHQGGFVLLELSAQSASLEEAFIRLTGQDVEYAGATTRSAELVGATTSLRSDSGHELGHGLGHEGEQQ